MWQNKLSFILIMMSILTVINSETINFEIYKSFTTNIIMGTCPDAVYIPLVTKNLIITNSNLRGFNIEFNGNKCIDSSFRPLIDHCLNFKNICNEFSSTYNVGSLCKICLGPSGSDKNYVPYLEGKNPYTYYSCFEKI